MESDGYFGTQASGYIEHYTASKALASSMAVLFGMFGMHAPYTEELNVYNPFTKQYSDKDGYQMFMFGESIDLYLQHVGVRSKEKTWHFQALKKQLQSMKKKRNTNNDVLYGVKSALRATMDEKRTGLAGSRRFLVEGSVVELAIGFYSIATDITYPELELNSDYLENIRKLDPSIAKTLDYARALHPRFVKVEDIKKSNVVVDVGDIEVPESHSYIANGFVVHNCNAEQLEVMAFAPETRRLTILTMNDSDEATIEAVMGKDVEHRKEMLFGSTNVDGEE
jgi:hypothetical protein